MRASKHANPEASLCSDGIYLPPARQAGSGGTRTLNGAGGSRNGKGAKKPTGEGPNAAKPPSNGLVPANGKPPIPGLRRKMSKCILEDHRLVIRCLAGDAAAWSEMYHRFHERLVSSIRAYLGKARQDIHLIDEISARVWYALVRNDFELLAKFDPERGCRLTTFMSLLAKTEIRLLMRSERRRRMREQVVSKPEASSLASGAAAVLHDAEFIATLSPSERMFFFDVLVAVNENGHPGSYSLQNHWQLRHRVRKKLQRFLGGRE